MTSAVHNNISGSPFHCSGQFRFRYLGTICIARNPNTGTFYTTIPAQLPGELMKDGRLRLCLLTWSQREGDSLVLQHDLRQPHHAGRQAKHADAVKLGLVP